MCRRDALLERHTFTPVARDEVLDVKNCLSTSFHDLLGALENNPLNTREKSKQGIRRFTVDLANVYSEVSQVT